MGTRLAAKHSKALLLAVGALIVFVSFAVVMRYLWSSDDLSAGHNQGKAWFTADDGKTWFADDATRLPPFEKDGKTVYGCVVWTADNGKTQWVSHLFRYNDAAKRSLTEAQQRLSKLGGPLPPQSASMEVKKPGTGNTGWVPALDQRGIEIQTPKCPAGDQEPQPLLP